MNPPHRPATRKARIIRPPTPRAAIQPMASEPSVLAISVPHGKSGPSQASIASDTPTRSAAPSVLDLGCGTGALAIAAAIVWPDAEILASDIDPEAVTETDVNAAKNGAGGRIDAFEADGFAHPKLTSGRFGLIFANILAGPLQVLAAELAARLENGGRAVLSGLLTEQIEAVEAAYAQAGLVTETTDTIDEWAILTLRRA